MSTEPLRNAALPRVPWRSLQLSPAPLDTHRPLYGHVCILHQKLHLPGHFKDTGMYANARSHTHVRVITHTCTLTHMLNCTEDSRLNTAKANHAHVHLRVHVRVRTPPHKRQLPEHGRSQCEQQWRRLSGAWSCPSLFSSQPTFVVAV